MSVSSKYVPLSTAKSWAKSLAKTSNTIDPQSPWPLSKCQLAVAQMLGFDHWHALNVALKVDKQPAKNTASVKSAGHFVWPDAPTRVEDWPAFVGHCLNIAGCTDMHLQWRDRQQVVVRLRVYGMMAEGTGVERRIVAGGMTRMLPTHQNGMFDQDGMPVVNGQYVVGVLSIPGQAMDARFQSVPIYPSGMDVVIRRSSEAQPIKRLTELGLPEKLVTELRRLTDSGAGSFFFTGTAGTGKTTLMTQVVNDMNEQDAQIKMFVVGDDMGHMTLTVAGGVIERQDGDGMDWRAGAVARALRSGPDVVVLDELREKKDAQQLVMAVQGGCMVLSTCHATPKGLLERLDDFGTHHNLSARGWAATRLLPVLCTNCRIPLEGDSDVSDRGMGCLKCRGLGITGRQLVVDLWEVGADGIPQQLFSQINQAKDLIRRGIVTLSDAEESLGPLDRVE